MVLNIDIAPTILDLAGIPAPTTYQGHSLAPLLQNQTVPWREDFLCEHHFTHPTIPKSEGLRSQDWKYFRYYEQDPLYECLYNLQIDPNETTNLAADPEHEDQLNLMRAHCDQLISEAQAGSP